MVHDADDDDDDDVVVVVVVRRLKLTTFNEEKNIGTC